MHPTSENHSPSKSENFTRIGLIGALLRCRAFSASSSNEISFICKLSHLPSSWSSPPITTRFHLTLISLCWLYCISVYNFCSSYIAYVVLDKMGSTCVGGEDKEVLYSEPPLPPRKLGIVRLDYTYPPAIGDADCPDSFSYETIFHCVEGLTFDRFEYL